MAAKKHGEKGIKAGGMVAASMASSGEGGGSGSNGIKCGGRQLKRGIGSRRGGISAKRHQQASGMAYQHQQINGSKRSGIGGGSMA